MRFQFFNELVLCASPFRRVARLTEQLQVFNVIRAAFGLCHDMINGEIAKRQKEVAPLTTSLLDTKEFVLMGMRSGQRSLDSDFGGIGSGWRFGSDNNIFKRIEKACLFIDFILQAEFGNGFRNRRNINTDPLAVEAFRGNASGCTPTKRIKHNIVFIGGGFDNAVKECKRFLGGVTRAFFA